MKNSKKTRLLERTFLFILILMIFTLSSFSAKGQMMRELTVLEELNLSYLDDLSFTEEKIIAGNIKMMHATQQFNLRRKKKNEIPSLKTQDSLNQQQFNLPKQDLVRKNIGNLQAPALFIPLN